MRVENLSNKWSKAAVIGTMWAASEIVLGSFLHNLKIPFSSTFLTGIGIILLVSISSIWKEKGLFWRAGLICALMKTISPSAVIFGPMIAIFMQSVFMEISTLALGKNTFGFIIGAVFASSWNVFQKIFNLLLFYGRNLIEVYTELVNTAQDQLNIKLSTIWLPILILLAIYILAGIIAVIIGKKIGSKIQSISVKQEQFNTHINMPTGAATDFRYSFFWLVINIALILCTFLLIYRSPVYIWLPSLGIIIFIWLKRYRHLIKKLLNPKIWVYFLIVTILVAIVFAKIQGNSVQEAFIIGLQMNGRAILLILGLSAIGKELYHPKIRDYFSKTYFKELPLALEIGFNHLPWVIARMPSIKQIFKNPVNVMAQVIAHADNQLQQVKKYDRPSVIIISGGLSRGKTSFLRQLVKILKNHGVKIGGFYAKRILQGDSTTGYNLINIDNQKVINFLNIHPNNGVEKIGKFYINPDVLTQGCEWILSAKKHDFVAIDEIGKLELKGRGWANVFTELLAEDISVILCVRDTFVKEVVKKFHLANIMEFKVGDTSVSNAADMIIKNYSSSFSPS
ncbi:MAG: hypothetical protein CSA39_06055 [Flavobacteriales bacterium]|nr:MAG: hypothetical protein CSA39_06055 [Flavobacteriales bacterium]